MIGVGYVYALCMYSERLQILVSPDQRRMLEAEARRRGLSVAALVRDAVEQHLGVVDRASREDAVAAIRALRGRSLTTEEMNRIVEEEQARA
jgi:hypothetical protein